MINTVQTEQVVETRRPLVSWGSIFAGSLLATGVMLLMLNFGAALGLGVIDFTDPAAAMGGLAVGTAVWAILTWAASLFAGGMTGGWLAGHVDRAVGTVHGMAVWALTALFTVFLGLSGISGALQAGSAVAGQGASALGAVGGVNIPAPPPEAVSTFQNEIARQLSQTVAAAAPELSASEVRQAINQLTPQMTASIAADLLTGNVDQARQTLAANTTLAPGEIDSVMSSLQNQASRLSGQFAQAAERTANYTSAALWVVFFSSVIGLIAAGFGGDFGSRRLAVSYRRFERI